MQPVLERHDLKALEQAHGAGGVAVEMRVILVVGLIDDKAVGRGLGGDRKLPRLRFPLQIGDAAGAAIESMGFPAHLGEEVGVPANAAAEIESPPAAPGVRTACTLCDTSASFMPAKAAGRTPASINISSTTEQQT